MGKVDPIDIGYTWEGDFLSLWKKGASAKGGGYTITWDTILTGFYANPGKKHCVGFELLDAAQMLMPYLRREVFQGTLCNGELVASYQVDTDTLALLSNTEDITDDQVVANGLVAHCNERGLAVGFTLQRAAELLLPYLETWRPWTEEEMAQIQRVMSEHDAAMRAHKASSS